MNFTRAFSLCVCFFLTEVILVFIWAINLMVYREISGVNFKRRYSTVKIFWICLWKGIVVSHKGLI